MVSILSVAIQPHVFLIAKALLSYSFLGSPVFLFCPVLSRGSWSDAQAALWGGMFSVIAGERT